MSFASISSLDPVRRAARNELVAVSLFTLAFRCPGAKAQEEWAGRPAVSENAIVQNFQKRVGELVRIREETEGRLTPLQPTVVVQEIIDHEKTLARGIVETRRGAKQGDLFTAAVISEFRRRIGIAMRGENGVRIRASLASAEPVRGEVSVNAPYPENLPLQSTPPTLLFNLPDLPPGVDYRIVGNALVLLDWVANVVLDFMPNAIPPAGT